MLKVWYEIYTHACIQIAIYKQGKIVPENGYKKNSFRKKNSSERVWEICRSRLFIPFYSVTRYI